MLRRYTIISTSKCDEDINNNLNVSNLKTFLNFLIHFADFTKKDNSTCLGKLIEGYFSHSDAKNGCKNNSNCNGFVNFDCDNILFWTCDGKIERGLNRSEKNSCAWKKSN